MFATPGLKQAFKSSPFKDRVIDDASSCKPGAVPAPLDFQVVVVLQFRISSSSSSSTSSSTSSRKNWRNNVSFVSGCESLCRDILASPLQKAERKAQGALGLAAP